MNDCYKYIVEVVHIYLLVITISVQQNGSRQCI